MEGLPVTVKPTIDMLRMLALDYRPEAPYFVCLDRDKRMAIVAARQLEADAREHLNKVLLGGSDLGVLLSMTDPDPIDKANAELADATAALTTAMDDALPWSVAIIFGSLPTSDEGLREGESHSYEGLLGEMSDDDGKIDTDAFADRLLTLCYLRTESPDSEDMNLTRAEASRLLDVSDRKNVRAMIIGHHLVGAAIPFDPRTSGQSATT